MSKGPAASSSRLSAPSRRHFTRAALLLPALAPLAGCSGSAALDTFDLSSARAPSATRGHGQVVIAEPVATSPIDSDRVIVRPTPESLATLKGAQWSDRLPRLVQTKLVQSFENSRPAGAVGRPGAGMEAAWTLTSEIRRFEIDVAAGEAVVELSVKLIAEKSGHVAANRVFTARGPGSAEDGAKAAAALDAAFGIVMRDILAWTATRV